MYVIVLWKQGGGNIVMLLSAKAFETDAPYKHYNKDKHFPKLCIRLLKFILDKGNIL